MKFGWMTMRTSLRVKSFTMSMMVFAYAQGGGEIDPSSLKKLSGSGIPGSAALHQFVCRFFGVPHVHTRSSAILRL